MNKRYYSYNRTHPLAHKYTIGGTILNAGVDLAGRAINPDGNTSGVGKVLSGASKIAGLIPGWGTAASVVLNAVGEGVDALWGSNINQAAIDSARSGIDSAKYNIGNSLTWDTLSDNMKDLNSIDINNIGTQGIFSHKVDDERERLRQRINDAIAAANFAKGNITTLEGRQMRGTAFKDGGKKSTRKYKDPSTARLFRQYLLSDIENAWDNKQQFAKDLGAGLVDNLSSVFSPAALERVNQRNNAAIDGFQDFASAMRDQYNTYGYFDRRDYNPIEPAIITADQKKLGGPIFKTDYDMGLTFVNNGGTHEQNPYGGVFMGMAPDGQPNQVEEGEIIFNDYVYSNRLKVPKAVRNKYKMREKKDLSFADAIEEYIKKNGIEERNNDPIANRGLEAFASELAMEQEMIKAKKEMRNNRQAANGGHLFATGGPYILYDRNYSDFDTLYSKESPYRQALDWFNNPENAAERDALIADINSGKYNNTTDNINGFTVTPDNWYRLATDYRKGPVHNALIAWANQTHADAEAKRALETLPEISDSNTLNNGVVGIRALNKRGELDNTSAIWNYAANKGGLHTNSGDGLVGIEAPLTARATQKTSEEEGSTYDPAYWWRMAGLGANAAGLLYNIFDPYHPQVVNEARYTTINPKYIGDYLIANPFDINYETSQQDANTAALRNALMQSVSPIRNASLLSADFNANATRGAARRQALEYNDAMRKAVTEFNRGTNQFNAQMYVDAATKNQAAKQAYFQDKLRQAQFNSQMDFYHKTAKDQAIGQGITSIADYLNDMGRENIQSGWVDALAKSGVFGSLNEPMTDILTRLMSSVGHTKNRKK